MLCEELFQLYLCSSSKNAGPILRLQVFHVCLISTWLSETTSMTQSHSGLILFTLKSSSLSIDN